MTMEKYIKTKEFAELTGVSVRTLQYYDDIKVLTPAYVNEQGHRFYDSDSFSSMFVILSLKNMGMTLSDIQQYLNNDSFDVRLFIREEKDRIQTALSDLQLRFMRLSVLEEKVSGGQDVTPYILPLFHSCRIQAILQKANRLPLTLSFGIPSLRNWISVLNTACLQKMIERKNVFYTGKRIFLRQIRYRRIR